MASASTQEKIDEPTRKFLRLPGNAVNALLVKLPAQGIHSDATDGTLLCQQRSRCGPSLDHPVSAYLDGWRNVDAQHFGCTEIEDQLELCWLLYRKHARGGGHV
jgi:hypothetical protein